MKVRMHVPGETPLPPGAEVEIRTDVVVIPEVTRVRTADSGCLWLDGKDWTYVLPPGAWGPFVLLGSNNEDD